MRPFFARAAALGLWAASSSLGCGLDVETPAPATESARAPGPCGTTENLFQGMFTLSREGGLEDLRTIITEHSAAGPMGRAPDLAIRNVLGAAIRIVTRLGISATREAALTLGKGPLAEWASSALVDGLRFTSGSLDGRARYAATESVAFYLRRCDAEPILELAERVLRLTRPSAEGGEERWLAAFLGASGRLLAHPMLEPFLSDFEASGERGRAAIVGLLNQVAGFLADEDFDLQRVRALFESSVYTLVDPSLAAEFDGLLALLEEAVRLDPALQQALRGVAQCSLIDEGARREFLGYVYDFSTYPGLSLETLLAEGSTLVADPSQAPFLDHLAGLSAAISIEREARQDIFVLVAVLMERPEVERALPLLIQLFERDLVAELLYAVTTLLAGCEAAGS